MGAATDQFVWDTTASIPLLLTDGPSLYIVGLALTPVAQVDASGQIKCPHRNNNYSHRQKLRGAHDGPFTRWSWVLLVTVPAAFAVGYAAAAIAVLARCGFDQCSGDPGWFASPSAPEAINAAFLGGGLMFGAWFIIPWLRRTWLRLGLAAIIGVLTTLFWLWVILSVR